MFDEIDRLVTAAYCRVLELDPDLPIEDAAARVEALLEHSSITNLPELVARSTHLLQRRGVLNPKWLSEEGIRPHFFMASSRPGYLKQLVRLAEEHRAGISQYIVYGEWDTILVLNGTDAEAATLRESLESSSVEPPLYFPSRTLLSYKYLIDEIRHDDAPIDPTEVNSLVRDYDQTDLRGLRDQLLDTRRLLGPTWVSNGSTPYPVVAFLGISLRGRGNVVGENVARSLTANEAIRDSLVHLFEVEQGRPFHYVAKLTCRTMTELDDVTTLIGSESLDGLRLEGTTYVVANGTEAIPLLRHETATHVTLGVDLSPLVTVAEQAIFELPPEAQSKFGALSELQQLSVVRSIVELQRTLEQSSLSEDTRGRFASALASFVRECAMGPGTPNLHGAIADAVIALEGTVKRLLSKLAYACLGNDPAKIQTELRLSTRTIANLSMAKVVNGLKLAREHPEFADYHDALDEAMLERLSSIASRRNEWLHDATDTSYGDVVEDARRLIVDAIETASWAEAIMASIASANSAAEDARLALPTARPGAPAVFISHATADGRVAERIAVGLKVFEMAAWYSEWELQPGDSIVEKIENAIAQSDILLVLLSTHSVASKWVRRELNSALAAQLAGQDVIVVPVLIEPCEIPPLLDDIFRVDLTEDFETGLIKLIEFLRERRRLLSRKPPDHGAPPPISS